MREFVCKKLKPSLEDTNDIHQSQNDGWFMADKWMAVTIATGGRQY